MPRAGPRCQPLLQLVPGTKVYVGPNVSDTSMTLTASGERKLYYTDFLHQVSCWALLNIFHRQQNPDQEVNMLARAHPKVISKILVW